MTFRMMSPAGQDAALDVAKRSRGLEGVKLVGNSYLSFWGRNFISQGSRSLGPGSAAAVVMREEMYFTSATSEQTGELRFGLFRATDHIF